MAPFDGTLETTTPLVVSPDLSKPTLAGLAWYLDHPELWQGTTMEWDFGEILDSREYSCGSTGCALGLARMMWPEATKGHLVDNLGEAVFGLDAHDDARIFYLGAAIRNEITPARVATRIRAYLSGQPIPL